MSATELTPIRLIMFTSETCVYCPPIEAIVHEVVGSGMQELFHVSTIDIDDDPEAAREYEINTLPTLVINEEVVLQGGMDDDSVRDLLWSTLLNYAVSSEEVADLTKTSLMSFTLNAWTSLTGEELLRKSVGDYTHIGVYQLILLSLYSLDPLISNLIYKAGHKLGLYGHLSHIMHTLNPKVGTTTKPFLKFKQLGRAFELYFSDRELIPTLIAESAKVVEITPTTMHLKVNDLASASMRVYVGEPMCGFIAGQLAGVTTAVMGSNASCEEQMCLANGGDFCLFRIEIGSNSKEPNLPEIENKLDRVKRRQNFYEVIHEITEKIEDSMLMKKLQRPKIGDYIHISNLQPIILSLKLLDRFSGSILYSGGRELGVFGPGKELLYRIVQKHSVRVPVPLETGIKLLLEYLTHPTTNLGREFGNIQLIHDESDRFIFEIEENAAVSGLSNVNLGETCCDFQAGFIAGRLHILIGLDPVVKEIECQASGYPTCKFEIKVTSNPANFYQ